MTRLRIFVLLVLGLGTSGTAQITSLSDPLPREAQAVLDNARSVAKDALGAYSSYHPDQPLFREATRLGRQAVALAPENPETLRFLAELYGVTDFYGPAFRTWQAFVGAGGTLDANAKGQFARNGNRVGYARYAQGDLPGALTAYRSVTRYVPQNERALRWSGRILLELERPRAALPYWQRLHTLKPGDDGAAYFLELAQASSAYGVAAAQAFYGGVTAYEAGQSEVARQNFTRATTLNPDYTEAWGYRGRVALEAGRFARAEAAYGRASELEPASETYRYFLQRAKIRQGEARAD